MSKRQLAVAGSCIVAALACAGMASATDHPVTLSQTLVDGTLTCSVSPSSLAVAKGDTITFTLTAADTGVTVNARKMPAGGGGMTLKPATGGGPDNDFNPTKGNPQTTQGVSAGAGAGANTWRYDVVFTGPPPGQPVLCQIDPVICIKDGTAEDKVGDPVCP